MSVKRKVTVPVGRLAILNESQRPATESGRSRNENRYDTVADEACSVATPLHFPVCFLTKPKRMAP